MCTVITLARPGHAWPLLLAANRDESTTRPWEPPAEYWPGVIAGRDRLGGGTWMGLNRQGVVAAILNRPGSLGPAPGKLSRGALPLVALQHPTAGEASAAVAALDGSLYRSFNLVVADAEGVWFVRNDEAGRIERVPLPPGLHMVTARDPDDVGSPRVARHRPRFLAAQVPVPPDWTAWQTLLADEAGPREATLCVPEAGGFGTVCASVLGLRADGGVDWRFAAGPPGHVPFGPVASV